MDCLGDLNPGQSVTIKVSVFMTAESGKPLDNQACVDPDHLIEQYSPPGRTDDCSTHTTITAGTKRSPNLFVTKNGDPTQVTGGDALTYTIGVQNNGDADAFSPVTITDVLPTSVTFVDANGDERLDVLGDNDGHLPRRRYRGWRSAHRPQSRSIRPSTTA